MDYFPFFFSGLMVVIVGVAYLILTMPKAIRRRRLQEVATKYHLAYTRTTRKGWVGSRTIFKRIIYKLFLEDWWKENYIKGNLENHTIEIFDRCGTRWPLLSRVPVSTVETVCLVDDVRQVLPTSFPSFLSKKVAVAHIDAFLQSLKKR